MEVRKTEVREKKKTRCEARYTGSWRFNQGVPFVSDISERKREKGGGGRRYGRTKRMDERVIKRERQTGARRTVQAVDSLTAA